MSTIATTRPSINRFDVDARLAGLEEKFRIVNNDELADALRVRLDELSMRPTSWMPEILSLFLQLSDRPAQNSRIEDVEFSRRETRPPPLSWTQILDCDPLDGQHRLWDNVDFAANESDEDYSVEFEHSQSPESTSSGSSSHDPGDKALELSIFVQQVGPNEKISSYFQRTPSALPAECKQGPAVEITESQMVKESLFMLRSLPTFMYVICETGRILYSRRYCTVNSPSTSITNLLGQLADMGTQLNLIRKWVRKHANSPLQQTLQAALAVRMTRIDRELSLLEANALHRKHSITLFSMKQDVLSASRYMLKVAELMLSVDAFDGSLVSCKILELLYEASCLSQSIGDIGEYVYMAQLFLECFLTYLKPVAEWMEEGELPRCRHAFFISKNEKTVGAEFFWREQFALHHTREGNLVAPIFLRSFALKILNTGKNVNFQKKLGQGTSAPDTLLGCTSGLRIDVQEESKNLRPFSELFHVALNDWIDCRYRISSVCLRQLLTVSGLQNSLDALEYIFFCRNGFLTGQIVSAISDRLDRCPATWNDRSALTGLFRSAFGALGCVDAHRITVQTYGGVLFQDRRNTVAALGSFSVHYPLTWSVANILRPESAGTYQRILTVLIQVRWAKYLLEGQRFTQTNPNLSRCYAGAPAFLLRHRLLWFTNLIFIYLSDVVLSPSTSQLRFKITKAKDIDEMVAAHEVYLVRLENQCLLSQKLNPVYQAVVALLDVAVGFAKLHSISTSQISTRQGNTTTAVYELSSDKFGNRSQKIRRSCSDSQGYDGQDPCPDVGNPPFSHPEAYLIQLNAFHQNFTRLHGFMLAGLRAVQRVDNDSCWEILAGLLTYRTGRTGEDSRDDA
ncbi:MAG: hypothetical protein Q9195_004278 [Heterodermia aff. obscurata]